MTRTWLLERVRGVLVGGSPASLAGMRWGEARFYGRHAVPDHAMLVARCALRDVRNVATDGEKAVKRGQNGIIMYCTSIDVLPGRALDAEICRLNLVWLELVIGCQHLGGSLHLSNNLQTY